MGCQLKRVLKVDYLTAEKKGDWIAMSLVKRHRHDDSNINGQRVGVFCFEFR